jgi:short-subunit dehydrogenase
LTKDYSVWITGANSGIGKALAVKFLENNYKTIGTARRENLSSGFFDQMQNRDLFSYHSSDISRADKVSDFYRHISKDHKIGCLINNAGITSFKPFVDNTISEIDSIIKTNLNGSIYAIKSVLPGMIESKSGIIINILSVAAKKVFTHSSIYAASKAGMEAFSKVLREEVRQFNIKVINVYPGATATEIWPENALEENANRMMTAENLSDFIFDIFCQSDFLSPEEITVRPIMGDL